MVGTTLINVLPFKQNSPGINRGCFVSG